MAAGESVGLDKQTCGVGWGALYSRGLLKRGGSLFSLCEDMSATKVLQLIGSAVNRAWLVKLGNIPVGVEVQSVLEPN